jgi:hypothetical protein
MVHIRGPIFNARLQLAVAIPRNAKGVISDMYETATVLKQPIVSPLRSFPPKKSGREVEANSKPVPIKLLQMPMTIVQRRPIPTGVSVLLITLSVIPETYDLLAE